jgi:hypothetical protein
LRVRPVSILPKNWTKLDVDAKRPTRNDHLVLPKNWTKLDVDAKRPTRHVSWYPSNKWMIHSVDTEMSSGRRLSNNLLRRLNVNTKRHVNAQLHGSNSEMRERRNLHVRWPLDVRRRKNDDVWLSSFV